jgi:hypothetical protein
MMSFLSARLDDHANPLLIRGIRQALRSRTYLGQYLLALLASLIATLIFADYAIDKPEAIDAGRNLFGTLFTVLVTVLMPIQVMNAYQAMLRERQDSTWELVLLSGMRPMQVVLGMLQSSMAQAALIVAAITPYLVMAYLLRGVDLGHVLLSLTIVFGMGVTSATFGLLAGSATSHQLVRRLVWLPLLIGFVFLGFFILAIGWNPAEITSWIVQGLRNGDGEVWLFSLFWVNVWVQTVFCCLILAANMLTHPACDRSSAVRLSLLGAVVNGLIWISLIKIIDSHTKTHQVIAMAALWLAIMAMVIAFLGGIEDTALSPRQARSIREARGLRRLLIGLVGPGSARGHSAGLTVMFAALVCLVVSMSMGVDQELSVCTALFLGYTALFMGLGELCWRGALAPLLDTPMKRGATLLITILLLSAIGPVLALLTGTNDLEESPLIIISPIFAVPLLTDEAAWELAIPILILGGLGLIPMLNRARHRSLKTKRVRAEAEPS